METVPADGEVFPLELTANLSTGGSAEDVTDQVHTANRFMAERIARIIGLDIAGIDVMAPTLAKAPDQDRRGGHRGQRGPRPQDAPRPGKGQAPERGPSDHGHALSQGRPA